MLLALQHINELIDLGFGVVKMCGHTNQTVFALLENRGRYTIPLEGNSAEFDSAQTFQVAGRDRSRLVGSRGRHDTDPIQVLNMRSQIAGELSPSSGDLVNPDVFLEVDGIANNRLGGEIHRPPRLDSPHEG